MNIIGHIEFILDNQAYIPAHGLKDSGIILKPGDLIRLHTPGGGGYGDPLERNPFLVADDVRRQYISLETARDVYGVLFQENMVEVDEAKTIARRQALRQEL